MHLKYSAPRAEKVCLQLEGVIAESRSPSIPNGKVYYYEYDSSAPEILPANDLMIL
jgi:hypothetical protein